MFERKGQIYLDGSKYEEEAALEAALDAGAEDFARDEDQFTITTDPTEVHSVKSALEEKGIKPRETEIAFIPKSTVHVEGKDAEALLKLLDEIEELDDVQKVASNFDVDMEQLAHA
jgi:transcriptional/translational regulatory protein YebC/TACO1